MADSESSHSGMSERGRRLSRLAVVALPVASAAAGVALVVLLAATLFDGGDPKPNPRAVSRPAATATATPIPSDAPLDRLVVSEIGVDAPVEVLTVEEGVIRAATGPEVVSLYDFSPYNPDFGGQPGFGRNAVFGGHVDYINYGPAVFWDLDELSEGDEVEVRLADGTVYRYAVTWNNTYPWSDMPWEYVLTPENGNEAVTLITCSGAWTGSQYTDARVVRAERIPDDGSLAAGDAERAP